MNSTESDSHYDNLEAMSTSEILNSISLEDTKVQQAVASQLGNIEQFVEAAYARMQRGGRVFYLGAGTSGRLGVLDASEIPPTFGVDSAVFIGIIAGGDVALRDAVENAEDDASAAWEQMQAYKPVPNDIVVGISASGTAPYVVGGIRAALQARLLTAGICCNPGVELAILPAHSIVAEVGPEFLTGSTRMKAGTAQKMILNMISTALMIRMGRVLGNKMVDMKLSNDKLHRRGQLILAQTLQISEAQAAKLLQTHGSVRAAIHSWREAH
jgi:N-acetylmuramic acid 6-phosphate etherase